MTIYTQKLKCKNFLLLVFKNLRFEINYRKFYFFLEKTRLLPICFFFSLQRVSQSKQKYNCGCVRALVRACNPSQPSHCTICSIHYSPKLVESKTLIWKCRKLFTSGYFEQVSCFSKWFELKICKKNFTTKYFPTLKEWEAYI